VEGICDVGVCGVVDEECVVGVLWFYCGGVELLLFV